MSGNNKKIGDLQQIAQYLQQEKKNVSLVYAFNGMGKTRLSKKFGNEINASATTDEQEEQKRKCIYYNAYTEDLFYWDNEKNILKIQPNFFTNIILQVLGQDSNIITNFQNLTNDKIRPRFNEKYTEITFYLAKGNDEKPENIKISKGEESTFVWCIFYSLIDEIITNLNEGTTDAFNEIEYIFIDDPVSSLDENNLIKLAVNLATIIKNCPDRVKFVITSHNAVFYNVLHNELRPKKGQKNKLQGYLLETLADGQFCLQKKEGDSNTSFFYHLHLKTLIENAIAENKIEKYHFMLLRNLYEKTAKFLGYTKWSDLLPEQERESYVSRIMNFYNHNTSVDMPVRDPSPQEKKMVEFLITKLKEKLSFAEND
jgi:wobble nucleotide-excising tRNase